VTWQAERERDETLVGQVKPLCFAERGGDYPAVFGRFNDPVAAACQGEGNGGENGAGRR